MPRRNVLSDAVFQQLLMLNDNYVCHEYWTLDDIITCRKTGCVVVFKSNLTSYTGGCLAFVMSSHSLFNFHSEGTSDFDWFLSFFLQKKRILISNHLETADFLFWFEITFGLARCGLGLAGLVLRCETRSCHARLHNDLEGHSNFSSTIYSFSILCLEHHYCGDQQWHSLT